MRTGGSLAKPAWPTRSTHNPANNGGERRLLGGDGGSDRGEVDRRGRQSDSLADHPTIAPESPHLKSPGRPRNGVGGRRRSGAERLGSGFDPGDEGATRWSTDASTDFTLAGFDLDRWGSKLRDLGGPDQPAPVVSTVPALVRRPRRR
jgi:hypothetical protein